MDAPENIPESGAVFTFGSGKLAGNATSCFWLKNDVVISSSCGDEHTALVTEKGKVYVYGSNNWGQLGLGHTNPLNKPSCVKSLKMHKATMVACGRNHTLVCTSDNKVFAFGNNSDSQLGVDTVNSNVPVQINAETLGSIKQIDAGADFSVALTTEGDLYTWGSNAEGQLGLGNDVNEATKPTMVKGLEQIEYVACGYYHTALVSKSGVLYTFGEDEYGKLGKREGTDTSVPSRVEVSNSLEVSRVACGGSHTAFISESGRLYTFGAGSHGELGHGADILQVSRPKCIADLEKHQMTNVSCGENFTSAITNKGRLYTFGDGRHGKLALDRENFANQFHPFLCTRLKDYSVSFAICGGCHMVVSASPRQHSSDGADSGTEEFVQIHYEGENRLKPEKVNGHLTTASAEHISELSRTLSAREKRRQGREKMLSQTLPPLRTLKPNELAEAAKSLPKPMSFHQSIDSEWPHSVQNDPIKDFDQVSEISTFNKVHKLVKVGTLDALMPVKKGVVGADGTDEVEKTGNFEDPVEEISTSEQITTEKVEKDKIENNELPDKSDTGLSETNEVTNDKAVRDEDESEDVEEDHGSLLSEEEEEEQIEADDKIKREGQDENSAEAEKKGCTLGDDKVEGESGKKVESESSESKTAKEVTTTSVKNDDNLQAPEVHDQQSQSTSKTTKGSKQKSKFCVIL